MLTVMNVDSQANLRPILGGNKPPSWMTLAEVLTRVTNCRSEAMQVTILLYILRLNMKICIQVRDSLFLDLP